ncbi:hypothetical protein KCG44_08575 [Pacificimonas sp. WHA3]|uniref:Uncharacterized protein n=1 Tax=Pacificimonas pallii TaxID=2827236 RepID=A0ABS6SG08_9SPHN|nr:hypothetical protein [Pacificimonas pallii]MBV7256841.1 hypothetical protein [Pacificimonas pallii]
MMSAVGERTMRLFVILFVSFAMAAGVAATILPGIQQQIMAEASQQSADDLAFTRTVEIEGRSKDGTETIRMVERYDPRRPDNKRWTLVSVDGREPTKDERKDADGRRSDGPIPGYYRLGNWFGTEAKAQGQASLHFQSFPKGTFDVGPIDLSRRITAIATIGGTDDAPYVTETRFRLKEPFRVMLVAKVTAFDAKTRYTRLPSGRPVLAEQTLTFTGSRFGKEGTQRTVTRYSDYVEVR